MKIRMFSLKSNKIKGFFFFEIEWLDRFIPDWIELWLQKTTENLSRGHRECLYEMITYVNEINEEMNNIHKITPLLFKAVRKTKQSKRKAV